MTVLELVPLIFTALVVMVGLCAISVVLYRPTYHTDTLPQHYTPADFDQMDVRVTEMIKAKHREGQRLAQVGK